MSYKVDSDRSKILQATGIVLSVLIIFLTLLLSIIEVADPTIENATKLKSNLSWLLEQSLYMQLFLTIGLILLSYLLALLFLLKKNKDPKKLSITEQILRNKCTMLHSIKTFKEWNTYNMHYSMNIPKNEFDEYLELFVVDKLIEPTGAFVNIDGNKLLIYTITEKGIKFHKKCKNKLKE